MNGKRKIIKKIIYKTFGQNVYAKAYAKGKIKDIKNGVLDEKEAAFLNYFIHEDSTVLDIGANYGHYAIDMSRMCPAGTVHAFEPIPFTYKVLESITRHFKSDNIILHHAAVSDSEGSVSMTIPLLDFGAPNTGVAYIGEKNKTQSKTEEVKTIKIDDLDVKSKVDFIKIDVEGHEPQAFKGMEKLILKDRPVILIEFSHSCLKRANTQPAEFAHYLQTKLNLRFAEITADKLTLIDSENPVDGYYFLFPEENIEEFQNLFV